MSQPPKTDVQPFLKWAGGKRWLYLAYTFLFPKDFERYIEPFLGGASIFFALSPARAMLSDANVRLIECYAQMRDNRAALYAAMLRHQRSHSDAYYYEIRGRNYRKSLSRAAQFLYLNRTCWNGLYRVNLKGEFNVPRGTKNSVLFEGEDFQAYATALAGTTLKCCDFENALNNAKQGDFVFIDPPYTAKHNYNGFKKYNEKIFSWSDQIRLRDAVVLAAERGAYILLCNAHHNDILNLYNGLGSQHVLRRKSVIAGDSTFRSDTTEIAITLNYEPGRIQPEPNGEMKLGLEWPCLMSSKISL
jgi:DNA adenine methylase